MSQVGILKVACKLVSLDTPTWDTICFIVVQLKYFKKVVCNRNLRITSIFGGWGSEFTYI